MAKITRDVLKVVNDDINKIKPQPIRSTTNSNQSLGMRRSGNLNQDAVNRYISKLNSPNFNTGRIRNQSSAPSYSGASMDSSVMDTINADIANMNAGKSLQHYSPTPSSTPSPTYSPSPTQSTPMPTVSGLDASM